MEKLINDPKYAVERAVIEDDVKYEGARVVVNDDRAAVITYRDMHKAVFGDLTDFYEYADRFGLYGDICLLGAPKNAPKTLGFEASACITYAYLRSMPPMLDKPDGVEIKRLAPTLASVVLDAYHNPGGGYTVQRIEQIMRDKGVFGAIKNGRLAGFIGRHGDGSMGMLEVFDGFKRQGIGGALERFMINYVMTFGRVPHCDVFEDNPASMRLQTALGLTPSGFYTFWGEILPK